ncbi:MAG: hypothetical protein MK135_08375 [Polyangiaceae bacterium]|nr:hypothetical protein [Polyangiaceae bacterium]
MSNLRRFCRAAPPILGFWLICGGLTGTERSVAAESTQENKAEPTKENKADQGGANKDKADQGTPTKDNASQGEADQAQTASPKERSKQAKARAASARKKNQLQLANALDNLAARWEKLRAVLEKTRALEEKVDAVQKNTLELEDKMRRSTALIAQTAARRERAKARLIEMGVDLTGSEEQNEAATHNKKEKN